MSVDKEEYSCPNCIMVFAEKKYLTYHIKNEVCLNKEYICKFCARKLSSKSAMYRHMKNSCKVKKQQEKEKTELSERLRLLEEKNALENEEKNAKIMKLEEEIQRLKGRTSKKIVKNNIKNNNSNNVTNIEKIEVNNGTVINNNITLVAFKEEDRSRLDDETMIKVLRKGLYSPCYLIDAVHFNPKYPEYYNLYISNARSGDAVIYDGNDWVLTSAKELINEIYDDSKDYIEDNYLKYIESLQPSTINALGKLFAGEDNVEDNTKKKKMSKEEKQRAKMEKRQKIKDVKNNIKRLLYNKRKIVINSKSDKKPMDIEVNQSNRSNKSNKTTHSYGSMTSDDDLDDLDYSNDSNYSIQSRSTTDSDISPVRKTVKRPVKSQPQQKPKTVNDIKRVVKRTTKKN